jgi:hypothetical protein
VAGLGLVVVGCAAMRQNLRGQELSFRGVWFCAEAGCGQKDMQRSRESSKDGATTVQKVKWTGAVAMAFTAQASMASVGAVATDCKGNHADVEADAILRPGKHKIGDDPARESWMILLDRPALKKAGLEVGRKGGCSQVMVTATGHWSDGATFSMDAGVKGS